MVTIDPAQFRALCTGETIVALTTSTALEPGDECTLAVGLPAVRPLKAAYRRWRTDPPPGTWTATVVARHPVDGLDASSFASRHLLADHPTDGIALILRVRHESGPVLSDSTFEARRRSLERALR